MTLRWLYHALPLAEWERVGTSYAPESLSREGFVHASHRDRLEESARLHVRPPCVVLRIDPRKVAVPVEEAATPRGRCRTSSAPSRARRSSR